MRDHHRRVAVSKILKAIGLGASLAACGGDVVVQGGGSGSGNASNDGGNGGAGNEGGTNVIDNASVGGFATTSAGGQSACGNFTTVEIQPPPDGPCSGAFIAQYICFSKPTPNASCNDLFSEACVLDAYACGFQETGDDLCGPDETATECCYTVVGDCPVGRPLFVAGRARLASLEAGDGWANTSAAQGSLPKASLLDASTRRALADFWSREALFEHASIASFSRFVLQLLALGAPLDLVRDASRAISEELTHAEVCLAFASAYEGAPLRPSALDVGGCLDGIEGKIAAAVGVAREGCIAETVSALQVSAARDAATDPAVRSALAIIAAQEMEHAVLSWRALSWLLSSGDPAMHAAVAEVFADARKHVGFGAVTEIQGDEKCMRGHGYLPVDERRAAAVASLSSVVLPCATALLGAVRLGSVSQPASLPCENAI